LLRRQFDIKADYGKFWYRLSPQVFFDNVSQYFIAQHKRTLPRGTKLLTVPSLLEKEMIINPHFRSLVHRGDMLLQAVKVWKQFYEEDFGKKNPSSLSSIKKEGKNILAQTTFFSDETKEDSKVNKASRKNSDSHLGSLCET
jgi:hypothetical protein